MSSKKVLVGLIVSTLTLVVAGLKLRAIRKPDTKLADELKQLSTSKESRYVAERSICN